MKGFTLIELLAVIIILAIVALIATPIILDVIEDSRESANKSQVELLLGGLEQLYASNMISENLELTEKFKNEEDVYSLIPTTNEKPANGLGKVNNEGKTAIAVEIDGLCYYKGFDDSELSIKELAEGASCILPPGAGEYLYQCKYYDFWKDEATPESHFAFDEATGTLTNYLQNDDRVVIPCQIKGVQVKFIGRTAITNGFGSFSNKSLTQVVIPDSVIKIYDNAFYSSSLTSVKIPDSVEEIGKYAFYEVDSLQTVDFGTGLKIIREEAFYSCDSLHDITIPGSVETIERGVFMNIVNVGNVTFEEGKLTYLPDRVFHAAKADVVILPSNLKTVDSEAFGSSSVMTAKELIFRGRTTNDIANLNIRADKVTFIP